MKKQNIILITIDSLRSDKISGNSKTPNLDSIIKNGIYFSSTISSSDATDSSLGSIFTGKYPFKHNITFFSNHNKANYFFELLKKNGYSRYSIVPNKSFFNTITKSFEHSEKYDIDPYTLLYDGTGNRIIKILEKNNFKEPWFFFIHLMDLHPTGEQFSFPKKFDSEYFGVNNYEKSLSSIDYWIGKIYNIIDLSNTIFIITSDHGDFIPIDQKRIDDVQSIQKKFRFIKKIIPLNKQIWDPSLRLLKSIVKRIRIIKKSKNYDDFEMRSYYNRTEGHLFDESIKVPLIIKFPDIQNPIKIVEQISSLDIFPTIFAKLNIEISSDIDGKNLLPLINESNWNKNPIYIESASSIKNNEGISIGVRTNEFKYFRNRNGLTNQHLFDLKNDPYEKINLVTLMPEKVIEMEKILTTILANNNFEEKINLSDDENKLVEDELKKLGYI